VSALVALAIMAAAPAIGIALAVALGLGVATALGFERWRRERALHGREQVRRIAFPFTGETLSEPALLAALRIARAEHATLIPIYLALVPRRLPVEVPLPDDCAVALPLLEAVEQRATRAEVPVDARIERGRTVRHALRQLMTHERFERMVVAAGADGFSEGFTPEDVAWLLAHAPGELVVLRPAEAFRPTATLTRAQQARLEPGESALAADAASLLSPE
jgi:hypothetical protein